MKHLLIIGVGVFSDIVYDYAVKSVLFQRDWDIKGFLYGEQDDPQIVLEKQTIARYDDYELDKDDVFICSYISNENRRKVYQVMNGKGAKFTNIIHPSANILRNVEVGEGNIIGAFSTLSANVSLGNMNIVQDHSNIGHDTKIGDNNHLYVGSILCGNNHISNCVSIYTGALIYPSIKIGDSSIVSAGSVVMRHVKEGQTVMGNPAKKVE